MHIRISYLRTFKSVKQEVASLIACHFAVSTPVLMLPLRNIATNVPEENCGYCESKGLIVQDKMERVQRR